MPLFVLSTDKFLETIIILLSVVLCLLGVISNFIFLKSMKGSMFKRVFLSMTFVYTFFKLKNVTWFTYPKPCRIISIIVAILGVLMLFLLYLL